MGFNDWGLGRPLADMGLFLLLEYAAASKAEGGGRITERDDGRVEGFAVEGGEGEWSPSVDEGERERAY